MTQGLADVIRAKLRLEGSFEFGLRGRCMEPLLREGDRVLVVPAGKPYVGDLALVILDDKSLALHRIVCMHPDSIVTKGDYSGKSEHVALADFLGVAREFSLEGSLWVMDPRNRRERADLAALSLSIDHKTGRRANDEVRALIWSLNESTRMIMVERAEHDCGRRARTSASTTTTGA